MMATGDLSTHNIKDIEYHKLIAKEYDAVVVSPRVTLNDVALSKFIRHLKPGKVMLDLGCGTGHATLRFSHLYDKCIAVDHSPEMLDVAKKNIQSANIQNVEFICDDVFDYISRCQKVDAIFCIGFIHHLLPSTHHELVLRLEKLLNPGGTLFISEPRKILNTSVPQKISEWNSSSIAPNLHYSCDAQEPDEEHIDENELLAILKKFNLNAIKKTHHWEIFPRTLSPSFIEKLNMKYLNWRYGNTGNVLSVLLKKSD